MIRIAIVEDEESYIATLKEYLSRYQEEYSEQLSVTVFHDGDEISSGYKAQFDIEVCERNVRRGGDPQS